MFQKLKATLDLPVDVAPLVTFRIAFGMLLLWDLYRYFGSGTFHTYYVEPEFLFSYYGFSWLTPPSSSGLNFLGVLLALCCIFVVLGLLYRVAIITFTVGFSYLFLLDQANYLNHFYLVIIFGILLCFLPAHRDLSIDSKIFPKLRSRYVPKWTLWVVVLQLEIVLIYAGIVKLNFDWLQLEPLRMGLDMQRAMPVFGYFFQRDWAVAIAAYGVIALHIVGAPLLLWKRTRIYVFVMYLSFHVLNHFVFNIGIFPWLTIAATTLLFAPEAHRKFWKYWIILRFDKADMHMNSDDNNFYWSTPQKSTIVGNSLAAFFLVWFVVQIGFPLRHWLYEGNVAWTDEGHRFAWRMKLRDKVSKSQFYVQDGDNGQIYKIRKMDYLTAKQARLVDCKPDMLIQFAHYMDKKLRTERGFTDPRVFVSTACSLNGREYAKFVAKDLDLTTLPRNLKHNEWILPLEVKLDQRREDYQRIIDRRSRKKIQNE